MGKAWEIFRAIVNAVLELGGSDEDLEKILTVPGLAQQIAELIRGAESFVQATYEVVVDYGRTLVEMIAAGKYDWVNPDITQEHFPLAGRGEEKREQALFWFRRNISSDDAIAEMKKAGYESEDVAGLLAFGRDNPELQRKFPIIALKSVWVGSGGRHRVPYLFRGGAERGLDLGYLVSDWRGDCRFLARKCQK